MSVIEQLLEHAEGSAEAKSSHWLRHTAGFSSGAAYHGIDGFGQRHSGAMAGFWNAAWQRILFPGSDIFRSPHYRTMADLCRLQGRALTMDSLRHVFTHRLLAEYPADIACVIGDGMSHFAGPRLMQGGRVVSVNLPEVLIADASLLENAGLGDNACICTSREAVSGALADEAVRFVMVPAQHADALRGQGIGLFVNIASFQEMTPELVAGYFDIIRSNGATTFYCCNREAKTLYGGERLVFDEYPWGDPEILFWEDCPWHQRFYSKRPPFVHRYDGNIRHALVRYAA